MKIYHNGDRCPCCGTILWNKSHDWLLEFSATVYAMGFREEEYPPAADAAAPFRQGGLEREPGPSRTPEDGMRIFRRGGES